MKVLFAVNNDDISNAIIKKYQKDYKQILSYKNVYYFNAILKELQKDKSYDRVIVSEDLEPFANNNYDVIDKFLFEKLDNISDEAADMGGKNTDIILICTDRRTKSDDMLVKLFGIGVYSAIVGKDRSIDEVCRLISNPRTKKEAKLYYRIDTENVNYQTESEDSVSETEVQNILAHYARLGKNEDKYADSFDRIAAQYTDNQLRIIIKYLPIKVKAVLESNSQKYQELVSEDDSKSIKYNQYNEKSKEKKSKYQVEMLKNETEKAKMTFPVIIPSAVNKNNAKKLLSKEEITNNSIPELLEQENEDFFEESVDIDLAEPIQETKKRGRGRPKKIENSIEEEKDNKQKRGRGRPKKVQSTEETVDEGIDVFNLDEPEKEEDVDLFYLDESQKEENIDLFNLDDIEDEEDIVANDDELNKSDDDNKEVDLFNLNVDVDDKEEDFENDDEEIELLELENDDNDDNNEELYGQKDKKEIEQVKTKHIEFDFSSLISKEKKIVSFVGTTKNGTSFIVNNIAHLLATRGIKTAILDMTKNKNSYYIYTNSDDNLIQIAKECMYKLRSGVAKGITINKNLDVYTSIPEEEKDYSDVEVILETLIKNYSIILIDCDFDTPMEYFSASQETYLVQSMDVLTMQPLTAFLRNLQSKGILKQEKLKIVINKGVNIKSVPIKVLIGGISKYNDPSMTYMKDLFDQNKIGYCIIPFEIPNYIKYLDATINCKINLNGYTKTLILALDELGNMVYPVLNKAKYSSSENNVQDGFSNEMNNTLDKMKKNLNGTM